MQAPGIDVFWPILATVLTTFVIVVASVAHSSMAAVGEGNPRTDWTPLPTHSAEQPFVVVQVASHPTRAQAQAEADKLRRSGLDAGVLRSDLYAPLNRGWFVVYVGPFDDTAQGRARALKITGKIDDSLVRTLTRR
ncbi:SPOR domain-containing protein [Kineosporia sp. J2-2]|uniref:SPOR domain-containing protein n=1 Tax=Kineosporia corallincola TaxID=2835133 RepID=A0ABS5TM51_9ACTN|nr:SPOR domain-containing protein [Kineosporia corallincola]MBT0772162.1 SPOR domain-containing protein [Kineosporia corallincola]